MLSRRTLLQKSGLGVAAARLFGITAATPAAAVAQAPTPSKPNVLFILADNLGYGNPKEEDDKIAHDSWVVGPILKMVAAFEHSTKEHPLIPMGTPEPYTPPRKGAKP